MHYLEKVVKRIFPLLAVIVVTMILISDIGLIIKYYQKPKAYALMENISFVHYFFLHRNGYQFALTKSFFSALLLAMWLWRLIYPAKVYALGYATFLYSFVWVSIGVLVLTGVVGVLQYSAGLPVNLFDFSPLVLSMPFRSLSSLVLIVVGLPLVLLGLPRLHNRWLTRANA